MLLRSTNNVGVQGFLPTFIFTKTKSYNLHNREQQQQQQQQQRVSTNNANLHLRTERSSLIPRFASTSDQEQKEKQEAYNQMLERNGDFDLTTALFCGGLAFDAYAEPPANSSRWERGVSSG